MPRLEDLIKEIKDKSQSELYDHIRQIREDRKLTKVPARTLRARKTITSKLTTRFGNMTEEEQAAFLKSVENLNEGKTGKGR